MLVYYDAGNMNMMAIKFFPFLKKKRLTTVHSGLNEVSALARLTLYENLFIWEEKHVHYPL